MSAHTSVRKGKSVICIMKDGSQIEGKFVERRSTFVIIQIDQDTQQAVPKSQMRAMMIRKLKEA